MAETDTQDAGGQAAGTQPDGTATGSGRAPGRGRGADQEAFNAGFRKGSEKAERGLADARREWMTDLGIESEDDVDRVRQQLAGKRTEAAQLEAERRRWQKQEADWKRAIEDRDAKIAEATAANLKLVLRGRAREIALELDAYSPDDVFDFIDRRVTPTDAGVEFEDGDFKIALDDAEANKKIRDHIAKSRPHWIRARAVGGSGGPPPPRTGAAPPNGNASPTTSDLAWKLTREAMQQRR